MISMINKTYTLFALCGVMLLFLGACGIKPSNVEPPDGATNDTFPQTYPNPQTDPQPSVERRKY